VHADAMRLCTAANLKSTIIKILIVLGENHNIPSIHLFVKEIF